MKSLYLYILIVKWNLNEFIVKNIYLYPVRFKYIEYFNILKVTLIDFEIAYFINETIYFKQHFLF